MRDPSIMVPQKICIIRVNRSLLACCKLKMYQIVSAGHALITGENGLDAPLS
jgi:hypothetical protein